MLKIGKLVKWAPEYRLTAKSSDNFSSWRASFHGIKLQRIDFLIFRLFARRCQANCDFEGDVGDVAMEDDEKVRRSIYGRF